MKRHLIVAAMTIFGVAVCSAQFLSTTKAKPIQKKAVPTVAAKTVQNVSAKAQVADVFRSARPAKLSHNASVAKRSDLKSAPRKTHANGVMMGRPEGSFYNRGTLASGGSFTSVLVPPFTNFKFNNYCDEPSSAVWVNNEEEIEGNEDNDLEYMMPKGSSQYSLYYAPSIQVGDDTDQLVDFVQPIDSTLYTFNYLNTVKTGYYYFSNGSPFMTEDIAFDMDGDGTAEDYKCAGIRQFITEKPMQPLVLHDLYVPFYSSLEAPLKEGQSLKCILRKVYVDDDGYFALGDEIATMEVTADDLEEGGAFGDNLYEFYAVFANYEEDEFGTQTAVPVIIDDMFAIDILGFDNEDTDIQLFGAFLHQDENEFYTKRTRATRIVLNNLDGTEYTGGTLSYYNPDAAEPYGYCAIIFMEGEMDGLMVDSYGEQIAPVEGGESGAEDGEENNSPAYLFTNYPIFDVDGEEAEWSYNYDFEGVPEWAQLQIYPGYYENADHTNVRGLNMVWFDCEPLPEGVKGRKATVTVTSARGAECDGQITIIQGEDPGDVPPVKEITDGKYILVNVATGKCWGEGNDWGTRASLVENPEYLKLLKQPDGTFHLETQVNNGGEQIYFNGDYMDNGTPMPLTITRYEEEPIGDGMDDVPVWGYTIANADGQYFGYDGTSTVLGKNIDISTEEGLLNALWLVVSEEEMMANLKYATAEDPINVTFLISDPNFGRNNRYYGDWTFEASNKNNAGDNTNFCVESYHSEFTMSQTLENVPNGVYKLTAQGFYRQDGEDNENLPVFFINDATSTFPLKTGAENSMANASVSFKNGLYTCEPIYVKVENGTITLGAKLQGNTNLWCIWDNFVLNYYGPDATIEEVKAAALLEDLYDLQDKAEELLDKVDNDAVKAALQEAINTAAGLDASSGEAAVKAAVDKLADAVDKAEANVIAQNVLPAMKALVDATNVYTEEALNQYYTIPAEKYAAGTLTKAEAGALQNPDVVTGWHEAITVDNFLLSAWDTNPDFVDAPYYINSWSVEGDNDGTNFHVPFFEYWTGDANSLGERTLTATMNNIPEGNYDVTVWARVRAKDGFTAPAYGINLQVNDGAEVNVAAGQQVGTSQFFLDTFKASGVVGADGVLKIKFNVAADNNISWLSFKNVKFEKGAAVDDPEPAVPEGWENLIANGNMAGDDVSSFFKVEPGTGLQPATITDGVGKNGSRGILVQSQDNPANAWDTQFFIRSSKMLAPGTKVHMEFDYMASKDAKISSQGHSEPTQYVNNDGVGNLNATSEWQRLSKDFTITGNVQTIAFNLAELKEAADYVFDNVVFWAEKQAEVEWTDIIVNGSLEGTEVANFFSKEAPSAEVLPSRIFDGMGKDGSRGIKVESAAGASQDWDTQFWIYLPTTLPEGTKYKVEFDYRSDVAGSADTQAHAAPGNYIHYQMIGSPNFTTDWQHYEASGVITADQAEAKTDGVPNGNKFQSIAFNLSKDRANAVKFFFDNIKFMVEKSWYDTGIRTIANDAAGKNIFNLRGQQVQNPSKGLYIINGKKVVVK